MSEDELKKMNPWKKKAWSTRVRRWLKMMPQEMLEKGTKTRVKEWVKDNVGRRGIDNIMWGRWKHDATEGEEGENTGRKKDEGSRKSRNPPTSRKQMRKLGEPQRKICRLEEQRSEEETHSKAGKPTAWSTPVVGEPTLGKPHQQQSEVSGGKKMSLKDGPEKDNAAQKRRRKEENQVKREQKAKARKD